MQICKSINIVIGIFLVCNLVNTNLVFAQSKQEVLPVLRERPRVALVLSGGGARGFAHIGVLRVLKEMRIPIDFVVGTSMGAVIGGAYAAGRSVEDIDSIVRNTSWDSVLAERPARDELVFRRREEDTLIASRIDFPFTLKEGLSLPPAAAGNASLEKTLLKLLPNGMKSEHVNHLPIPFRSVASDLVTGEMVELIDTPLFLSLRASLSVPGMFAPVHVNQRLVVDGGLVRNLPIDMARKMGADVIIAVNVGTPLAKEQELGSALSVAQQMLHILTEQNVQRSIKELADKDILITPNLMGINFFDFDAHHNAMLAGDIATRELTQQLRVLSVSKEDYVRYDQLRVSEGAAPDKTLRIAKISVEGTERINPEILIKQSGLVVNQMATEEQVRQVSGKIYGRGDIDHVEIDMLDRPNERDVTIKTHEAVWSKNRVRFGLELYSDFRDTHTFSIGAMDVSTSLNQWGGESRVLAKFGSNRIFSAQFFQPLGPGSPWYIAPSYQYGATSLDTFSEGRKQTHVGYNSSGVYFPIGYQFNNWGDLQLGIRRERAGQKTLLPEILNSQTREWRTTEYARFRIDTLDSLAFPSRGSLLNASWERSVAVNPSKKTILNSSITGMYAFSAGESAGHIYGEWARSQGDTAPLSLGGFLRLSGIPVGSLSSKTILLGRYVWANKLGNIPLAWGGGAIRLGTSVEVGGGFRENESIKWKKLKTGGSGFISVDTRFGPLYFGVGSTERGGSTVYVFLGPVW